MSFEYWIAHALLFKMAVMFDSELDLTPYGKQYLGSVPILTLVSVFFYDRITKDGECQIMAIAEVVHIVKMGI